LPSLERHPVPLVVKMTLEAVFVKQGQMVREADDDAVTEVAQENAISDVQAIAAK
jgi:hypothetical protein